MFWAGASLSAAGSGMAVATFCYTDLSKVTLVFSVISLIKVYPGYQSMLFWAPDKEKKKVATPRPFNVEDPIPFEFLYTLDIKPFSEE